MEAFDCLAQRLCRPRIPASQSRHGSAGAAVRRDLGRRDRQPRDHADHQARRRHEPVGHDFRGQKGAAPVWEWRLASCQLEGALDGAAELAQQAADRWSEDDQAGDGQHGHQRDDEAVLDQALGSLACLENHDQMYLSLQLGALRMLDLARQPKTQNYRSGQPDG